MVRVCENGDFSHRSPEIHLKLFLCRNVKQEANSCCCKRVREKTETHFLGSGRGADVVFPGGQGQRCLIELYENREHISDE